MLISNPKGEDLSVAVLMAALLNRRLTLTIRPSRWWASTVLIRLEWTSLHGDQLSAEATMSERLLESPDRLLEVLNGLIRNIDCQRRSSRGAR